jgi:release factor glutamine methyltransferase
VVTRLTLEQLVRECRSTLEHETADFDLAQLVRAQFGVQDGLSPKNMPVGCRDAEELSQKVRRLKAGYPLQYLLGEWEFYSIPLAVGEGVLIPRPDTETVVDAALSLAKRHGFRRIADLGAGSGAISLALAKNLPGAQIFAVENAPQALNYLHRNIARHPFAERITVMPKDMLGELSLDNLDMVVSNPPYLDAGEMQNLPPAVCFEPKEALFGGGDGLVFYRRIAAAARALLAPDGFLVFEAGWTQALAIAEILRENGYRAIDSRQDYQGIARCVFAQKA